MKVCDKKILIKSYALPTLDFEDQELTSFGGLVMTWVFLRALCGLERAWERAV